MQNCLITFRSITPAQKGERLLRSEGLECTLSRTPKWAQEQGCSYSLRVRHIDAMRCTEVLRREKVPFRKIYLIREGGRSEELTL